MTPENFYGMVLMPGAIMTSMAGLNTFPARVLMMAIAGQESGWSSRIQIPGGQARGYWQCEQGGAVSAVLTNAYSIPFAHAMCARYDVGNDPASVWQAIAYHDILAYTVARLALWLETAPLPAVGDVHAGWDYYLNVWRPGKPRPTSWGPVYAQALAVVR